MTEIAVALLRLPDGKVVFQRRDGSPRLSPHKLGFFGGHVELDELPAKAMVRELGEETSLDAASLLLSHLMDFQLPSQVHGEADVDFHIYQAVVPDANFAVYEGAGVEVYTREDALIRDDLSEAARYVLEHIEE
ncbi:MAG TPA: NUDIX domain-containing protein [Candidatus Saccharimonadales bacterium]|nr:NUDIX domain-containing protein [Candidatus Saccharimonadales bacterium]